MCFPAVEIEQCRLLSIAAAWRLIGSRRAPLNTPSEWNGWQVVNPDADRRLYAERSAAKLCARCGSNPPRPDRKTCEDCAAGAAAPLGSAAGAASCCRDVHPVRQAVRRRRAVRVVQAGLPARRALARYGLTSARCCVVDMTQQGAKQLKEETLESWRTC